MAQFRKKPVVIEAIQYTGNNTDEILSFAGITAIWSEAHYEGETDTIDAIATLEGQMQVTNGDWIIKGVNGEFYPCKPDIFEKTYEAVD